MLAVIKARDYYDALEIANNTEYGLTGSVYTRSREKIELAKEIFHVGNLCINRRCTGLLVGANPLRRLQYVGHRFQGRRQGLPATLPPGQVDCGEDVKPAGRKARREGGRPDAGEEG